MATARFGYSCGFKSFGSSASLYLLGYAAPRRFPAESGRAYSLSTLNLHDACGTIRLVCNYQLQVDVIKLKFSNLN